MRTIKRTAILLAACLTAIAAYPARYTVSGYARDRNTGEELIGVNVYVEELKAGTASNIYGFYSLTLEAGQYTLRLSYLGYADRVEKINLGADLRLNLDLSPSSREVEEIVVSGQRQDRNISDTEMSVERLQMSQIKQLPSFMGETDVIKSLTLMPGVQSGGEGSSGLYVRGGGPDQNMILLDEAPVYNSSHLMGFFSVFNPDVIKEVKLYKGGIPSRYGGRLSSLIDIHMLDGNSRRLSVTGSFGNISGKLAVEGPIVKNKVSFIVAARRTWADIFTVFSPEEDLKRTKLYFYDLNAKINARIGENDRLFLSAYMGEDVFGFGTEFGMAWGNKTASLRWNHIFNNKLFVNNTLIYSDYNYRLDVNNGDNNTLKWESRIQDILIKNRFNYFLNPQLSIYFGAEAAHHHFEPGAMSFSGASSFSGLKVPYDNALEYAAFIGNEHKINSWLSAEYGLRVSAFQNIGPGTVNIYEDPSAPAKNSITDKKTYGSFETINTSYGLEPRANINFRLTDNAAIKTSYNRTFQYLNLVTNTNSPTPLDIYIPSSQYIKPQKADQVAAGYFRNFRENMFETSAEIYYKKMYNQIDYRDNAELFLNSHIETEILQGQAYSYGLELMARKQQGRLGGWISYTYSKTRRTIAGINEGKEYPPTYDRTHDISLVGNYQVGRKWTLGGNWVYSTGLAQTFPTGGFRYGQNVAALVGERNSYRTDAFHRLDLSATLQMGIDKQRRWEHSLNFSIYNVYSRKNPYSVYFRQDPDNMQNTQAVQLSIIGMPVPAITYNFKF
jgi:hypothetical protein